MSNLLYGHVGYGLILADADDEDGIPDELGRFETEELTWGEGLLKHLYPEGVPTELETDEHFLKGHDESVESDNYEIPLLVIKDRYGITDYRHSPDDFSDVVKAWQTEGTRWDALIAEFVNRCQRAGISLYETNPHFILYLSWDHLSL